MRIQTADLSKAIDEARRGQPRSIKLQIRIKNPKTGNWVPFKI